MGETVLQPGIREPHHPLPFSLLLFIYKVEILGPSAQVSGYAYRILQHPPTSPLTMNQACVLCYAVDLVWVDSGPHYYLTGCSND